MPDYRNAAAGVGLQQLLQGLQPLNEYGNEIQKQKAASDQLKLASILKGQATDEDIARLQKMKESGLVEEGGQGKVGEVSTGADPYAKNLQRGQLLESNQRKAISQNASKAASGYESQVDALNTIHTLLDNPNSIDQKQLGAMEARVTEGQGQRLLQSLVQELGANPNDLQSKGVSLWNYVTSQAKGGVSSDKLQAFRDNLYKHQDEISQQVNNIKNQQYNNASFTGTTLLPQVAKQGVDAAFSGVDSGMGVLNSRKQKDFQQRLPPPGTPPSNYNSQLPKDPGILGSVKNAVSNSPLGRFFNPGQSQQPQAAPQQPQMSSPATPPTPQGQRPMKTLRNKVTGAIKQVYTDTGEDVPGGQQ